MLASSDWLAFSADNSEFVSAVVVENELELVYSLSEYGCRVLMNLTDLHCTFGL